MSNTALKNFFIILGVVIIGAIVIFAISKASGEPTPSNQEEKEVEDVRTDINGNEIVEVDGEEAIFLE